MIGVASTGPAQGEEGDARSRGLWNHHRAGRSATALEPRAPKRNRFEAITRLQIKDLERDSRRNRFPRSASRFSVARNVKAPRRPTWLRCVARLSRRFGAGRLDRSRPRGGEIRAFVTAVPEPATYGLMLGGLGLVGWIARRRKG